MQTEEHVIDNTSTNANVNANTNTNTNTNTLQIHIEIQVVNQPNLLSGNARLNIFQSSDSTRMDFRVRLGLCNSTRRSLPLLFGFHWVQKNLDGANQPIIDILISLMTNISLSTREQRDIVQQCTKMEKNLDGSNQPNDLSHCNLDFIDLGTVQLSLEKQRLQINACLWNSHLKHCISKCKVEAQMSEMNVQNSKQEL